MVVFNIPHKMSKIFNCTPGVKVSTKLGSCSSWIKCTNLPNLLAVTRLFLNKKEDKINPLNNSF